MIDLSPLKQLATWPTTTNETADQEHSGLIEFFEWLELNPNVIRLVTNEEGMIPEVTVVNGKVAQSVRRRKPHGVPITVRVRGEGIVNRDSHGPSLGEKEL